MNPFRIRLTLLCAVVVTNLAALPLISAEITAPPTANDFELDAAGWAALGNGTKVTITHDAANVKAGKGALQFDYPVGAGGLAVLYLPVEPPLLAPVKSFHFWIKADHTTPIIVALQEKDGGRYNAVFTAPGGRWQEALLTPSDFILSTQATDPKDPDHKLDMDQVESVMLADMSQLFAQVGDANLAALLNVKTGPHTFYLDDFSATADAHPDVPAAPRTVILDRFDRPEVLWVPVGGSEVGIVSGKPLDGPGFQATYHQSPGKVAGWYKPIPVGLLTGTARIAFPVASGIPCTLLVQVEETSGGKYNAAVDVPGGSQVREASVAWAGFKPSGDSHDDDGKLDLDQVKQVLLMDPAGLLGGAEGDNTLWIGPLRATIAPAILGAGKIVTGRVLTEPDGKPISGATVTLSEGDDAVPLSEAQTLINGSFILKAPEPGKFRLRASDAAHTLSKKEIDVGPRGATGVEVTMGLRPVVQLRILSPAGVPLAAGPIEATAREVSPSGTSEGMASQLDLPEGRMNLSFEQSFPGDKVQSVSLWVRSPTAGCADMILDHWPAAPVDVKLTAGESISGTVVDGAAKPLAGAPVIAFRFIHASPVPDLAQHAFTVTDAAGRFTLPALPDGSYGILVKSPTAKSKVSTVVVAGAPVTAALVADQKPTL